MAEGGMRFTFPPYGLLTPNPRPLTPIPWPLAPNKSTSV
jgi:hypothetical protein